ncbi:MAG: family 43 glycosylhydrolase [Bacillales bacterium]|jgi:arabinan endo-1,5-alpha-L-arabinosidase|nr:family 43 glycosylhydrolase [Bacillales bacterium]
MKAKLLLVVFLLVSCTVESSSSQKESSFVSSSETAELEQKTFTNPMHIIQEDGNELFVTIADPELLAGDDGYYYMYPTNAECEMGNKGVMFDLGPIFRSDDMQNWHYAGSAFEGNQDAINWNIEAMKTGGVWAPSVLKVGDRYNYYYSLSGWGDTNPGIGVASSPTPYGPWTHYGKLVDQVGSGVRNGIDPHVFYEGEQLYMIWGSFFGIAIIELTDDGLEVFYGSHYKDYVKYIIENNNGTSMDINKNYEGSFLFEKDGYYYYMGSQGSCCSGISSTYRVKVGRSDTLLGPYLSKEGHDLTEEPYGELAIAPNDLVTGTGGSVLFEDFAGELWMAYHGFYKDGLDPNQRVLFIDKVLFDAEGWPYIENKEASLEEKVTPWLVKR